MIGRRVVSLRPEKLPHGRKRSPRSSGSAVVDSEGFLKAMDKAVAVTWLGQIAGRSGCKSLCTGFLIGKCCEEDEWKAGTLRSQMILQLDAAHARHLDIRNDAREVVKLVRLQERLGRCESMHDISERPHEAIGRDADGFIVINDRDERKLRQIDLSWMLTPACAQAPP